MPNLLAFEQEALGSVTNEVQTNYFGKGDTSSYDRATWPAVSSPQDTWHTYTVNWQKDAITWSIDGNAVRTLTYDEAKGGSRFPQTPMRVRMGIWAGGDPSNGQGTIEWAGGQTDYSQAPFTMYVKDVHITNANPAESYIWTDQSGSYESIKLSGASSLSQSSSEISSTATAPSVSSDSATAATTLATTTQSSSGVRSTAGSSSTASASGAASASGSSAAGSGSGSATTGSSSSTSSSASASTSPAYNAATNLAATYLGPISLLALATAFIQL